MHIDALQLNGAYWREKSDSKTEKKILLLCIVTKTNIAVACFKKRIHFTCFFVGSMPKKYHFSQWCIRRNYTEAKINGKKNQKWNCRFQNANDKFDNLKITFFCKMKLFWFVLCSSINRSLQSHKNQLIEKLSGYNHNSYITKHTIFENLFCHFIQSKWHIKCNKTARNNVSINEEKIRCTRENQDVNVRWKMTSDYDTMQVHWF